MHSELSVSITDSFTSWCIDMASKVKGSHTSNFSAWKQILSSNGMVPDSQSYHDDSNLNFPEILAVVKQDNPKLDGV